MDRKAAKKRAVNTLRAEISAVSGLRRIIDDTLLDAVEMIHDTEGKIVVIGVGKSGFIAMKISATLTSLGRRSVFMHPVEALHGDTGLVSDGDTILALSHSGTTAEIVKIVSYLKSHFDVGLVSITGKTSSRLAKLSDHSISTKVEEEGCPLGLAPMSSTSAALVVGDLIASALTSPDTFRPNEFARFHPGGTLGLSLVNVDSYMVVGEGVPLVTEDSILKKTLKTISEKKKGVVGITGDQGKLIGVITDGDVRRFFQDNVSARGKKASDLMSRKPKVVRAHNNLKEALEIMERYKITSLFVVDTRRQPVGLIHMHDILDQNIVI